MTASSSGCVGRDARIYVMNADMTTVYDGGWLRVKVPLPFSLKWVNAYLLPGDGGWTLIDPGLRWPDAEACWERLLPELRIGFGDIAAVVLTHHHPDHYGLAGWFQERTGAPVYISEAAFRAAQRMWGKSETFSDELVEAFLAFGLPDELVPGMREHLGGVRRQVVPHPADVRKIVPGERLPVAMAGTEWLAIGGEGHGPGHVSFYDARGRRMLCGDQVLPDITPNIGWLPGGDPDPLLSFYDSLRKLSGYDVATAFPGHRDPFSDFAGRIESTLRHHDRRLLEMRGLIAEAGPLTPFEVCERIFGARLRGNAHNLRFGLAETIAHLVRLERAGALCRQAAEGPEGANGRQTVRFAIRP
ncbi:MULTISPECIES: MBL fold metallo-hydrolase [Cohnella]|uniref:MBL fold metallo-hydrolase n=1 Tax=Cohnella TaxID=329857 RepID=UPI001F081B8F|nr:MULTISPECIES: MBL fold metallo-hydrolase [Cohnella]